MKKKTILLMTLIIAIFTLLSGCGKSNQVLPDKLENIGVDESEVMDKGYKSTYPIEYLGGVWVIKGFTDNQDEVTTSTKTITVKSNDGKKVELFETPVQLNLMPFKENPFEKFGVGYGEILFEKKDLQGDYFSRYYTVPVVYDTKDNILLLGIISDILVYEEGVLTDEMGNAVNELQIEELTYEMEWTGWDLVLKQGKDEVNYVPSDIDAGEGVAFSTKVFDNLGLTTGKNLVCTGMAELHEDYEIMDNIIRVKPSQEGYENIQFALEKPLESKWFFENDGTVKVDVMDKGTFSYKFLYSGRSLVLMNEEKSSLYSVYAEKTETSTNYLMGASLLDLTNHNWLGMEDFDTGYQKVKIYDNDNPLLAWGEYGAMTNHNLEELLAPGELKDIEILIDGSQFTARIINPYNVHINVLEATIAGVYFEQEKSDIIFGRGDGETGLAYGVSDMQDVVDYWNEIPFEKGEDYLTYKVQGISRIRNFIGLYDQKEVIIKDDGEREVKFLFENGVLSGIEKLAPSLLYSGLQDNIIADELTELTPSYVASVTVVRDTILQKMKKAFEEEAVDVNINESTGEIVMPNDVLFQINEYELSENGKIYIDKLMNVYAKVLLNDEFADVISGVAIDGHCDPNGSDAYNQVLSQNRADSVKQWCIDSNTNVLSDIQKQMFAEKATAKGYSFSDPVFDDNGNVNNEASRRVTIKFFVDIEAAMQEAN